MATRIESEREEALSRLREWLKPGDTVHTILRHVSRSGMFRRISLVKLEGGGRVISLDWNVAKVFGKRLHDGKEGIPTSGCGMDMGFHLVYNLSYDLWPKGYGCIGKGCPSNDHTNGDRDYTTHERAKAQQALRTREAGQVSDPSKEPGHWHRDGGYALKHSWL